jgi:hypothetical protein
MAKGNPNPSPATRFGAGNPSRAKQKGARDRFSAAFLTDFADDYAQHGKSVIETVRVNDPVAYMRIGASLLPKLLEIDHTPESDLSDEQVEALYHEMLARMMAKPKPLPAPSKRVN